MKYLVYLVLIAGSYFLYTQLIKAHAKRVQKSYEPLEYEYDMSDDENRKAEILEELSKMEAQAFKFNSRFRLLYPLLIIAITILVLILPSIEPTLNSFEMLFTGPRLIVEVIILTAGLIFNSAAINFFHNTESLFGMVSDISLNTKVNSKIHTQQRLNCIYPDRFPVSNPDPLAGYEYYRTMPLAVLQKYYLDRGLYI